MAESPIEHHPSDESAESVAFRLMLLVADLENKTLHGNPARERTLADRQWILDTYAECLRAVRLPEERRGHGHGGEGLRIPPTPDRIP
jgi:hypothetical protein